MVRQQFWSTKEKHVLLPSVEEGDRDEDDENGDDPDQRHDDDRLCVSSCKKKEKNDAFFPQWNLSHFSQCVYSCRVL